MPPTRRSAGARGIPLSAPGGEGVSVTKSGDLGGAPLPTSVPAGASGAVGVNVTGQKPEAVAQGFPPGLVFNSGSGKDGLEARRAAMQKLNNRALADIPDDELKELAVGFGATVTPFEHGQQPRRDDFIRALEAAGAGSGTVDPRGMAENEERERKAREDQAERERDTAAEAERRQRTEAAKQEEAATAERQRADAAKYEEGNEEGKVNDQNRR